MKNVCRLLFLLIMLICIVNLNGCCESDIDSIPSITDFEGKKIAVISGSVTSSLVIKSNPNINDFKEYDTSDECIAALKRDEVDAVVFDEPQAEIIVSRDYELFMFPDKVFEDSYGIATRKGSELSVKIAEVVNRIKNTDSFYYQKKIWYDLEESKKVIFAQDWEGINGTLKCAVCDDFEPLSYVDRNTNEFVGFNISLLRMIAKELKMNYEVTKITLKEAITAITEKDFDISIGCISITPERMQQVDLVKYLDGSPTFIIKRKDADSTLDFATIVKDIENFKTISDLEGKKIGAQNGSIFSYSLVSNNPRVSDFFYFTNVTAAITALRLGKIDAVAADYPVAELLVNKYKSLAILPEKICNDTYGFGFCKKSDAYEKFSAAFEKIKNTEEFKNLKSIWLSNDDTRKVLPKQTWPGTNGKYKVCCSMDMEPMCYKDINRNLAGYDLHLALLLAKELDVHLEFTEMTFDQMIPALKEEKFDMCCGAMSVTEERQKEIDMLSYLEGAQCLVILKPLKDETPDK